MSRERPSLGFLDAEDITRGWSDAHLGVEASIRLFVFWFEHPIKASESNGRVVGRQKRADTVSNDLYPPITLRSSEV